MEEEQSDVQNVKEEGFISIDFKQNPPKAPDRDILQDIDNQYNIPHDDEDPYMEFMEDLGANQQI